MSLIEKLNASKKEESIGKKILRNIVICGLTAVMVIAPTLMLTSCKKSSDNKELEAKQAMTYPLWSHTDLELNKYKGKAVVYTTTVSLKPDFYKGSMPLEYSGTETPGRGYTYSSPRMLKHEFKDFTNLFIYNNTIFAGVVAVNRSNALAAEARIMYFNDNGMQGIKIDEYHYDSTGKLIFNCKSMIDSSTGYKKNETEKLGKKQKEYFFLIPLN